MRNIQLAIFILSIIFIITNVFTEWKNRKNLPWQTNPLSSYLAGVPYAWVQDIGYFGMAVALLLFAWIAGFPWGLSFLAAALALPVVVITKYMIDSPNVISVKAKQYQKWHDYSAGIAFLGMTVGMLRISYLIGMNSVAFVASLAAPAIALLFMRFWPKQTTYEEKAYTAALMVADLSWCSVVLGFAQLYFKK